MFHRSVNAIDASVYTPEQQEAWVPKPPNYQDWFNRLNEKRSFKAIIDDRIVGFEELDAGGHIDCVCTHPVYRGIGVATVLYERLLAKARARIIKRLYV